LLPRRAKSDTTGRLNDDAKLIRLQRNHTSPSHYYGSLNNGIFTILFLQRLARLVQGQLNQNSPQQLPASHPLAGEHLLATTRWEAEH
jgi:hypothetical protein